MNHRAKISRSKVISFDSYYANTHAHTHTHTAGRLPHLHHHKLVGNDDSVWL